MGNNQPPAFSVEMLQAPGPMAQLLGLAEGPPVMPVAQAFNTQVPPAQPAFAPQQAAVPVLSTEPQVQAPMPQPQGGMLNILDPQSQNANMFAGPVGPSTGNPNMDQMKMMMLAQGLLNSGKGVGGLAQGLGNGLMGMMMLDPMLAQAGANRQRQQAMDAADLAGKAASTQGQTLQNERAGMLNEEWKTQAPARQRAAQLNNDALQSRIDNDTEARLFQGIKRDMLNWGFGQEKARAKWEEPLKRADAFREHAREMLNLETAMRTNQGMAAKMEVVNSMSPEEQKALFLPAGAQREATLYADYMAQAGKILNTPQAKAEAAAGFMADRQKVSMAGFASYLTAMQIQDTSDPRWPEALTRWREAANALRSSGGGAAAAPPTPVPQPAQGGVAIGTIKEGKGGHKYKYIGGPVTDPKNWQKQ